MECPYCKKADIDVGIIRAGYRAYVLRNAETITNGDGTVSFLPNHNIFLAALIVAIPIYLMASLIGKRLKRVNIVKA